MRIPWAVVVVVAGMSVSGLGQQSHPLRVKPSAPERTKKSTTPFVPKATASSANSKDLAALEHQTAKSSAPKPTGVKHTATASYKPMKEQRNPPMNLGSGGGGGGNGLSHGSSNPYKGRLKQKYSRQ